MALFPTLASCVASPPGHVPSPHYLHLGLCLKSPWSSLPCPGHRPMRNCHPLPQIIKVILLQGCCGMESSRPQSPPGHLLPSSPQHLSCSSPPRRMGPYFCNQAKRARMYPQHRKSNSDSGCWQQSEALLQGAKRGSWETSLRPTHTWSLSWRLFKAEEQRSWAYSWPCDISVTFLNRGFRSQDVSGLGYSG